jgi:hypothetical protein
MRFTSRTLNGILPFTVIPANAGIHLFNNVVDMVDPSFRWGDDEKSFYINAQKVSEPSSPAKGGTAFASRYFAAEALMSDSLKAQNEPPWLTCTVKSAMSPPHSGTAPP